MEEQRVDENNADQWWNDTDGEKQNYLEKNLCLCLFLYHKLKMEVSVIEPDLLWWEINN